MLCRTHLREYTTHWSWTSRKYSRKKEKWKNMNNSIHRCIIWTKDTSGYTCGWPDSNENYPRTTQRFLAHSYVEKYCDTLLPVATLRRWRAWFHIKQLENCERFVTCRRRKALCWHRRATSRRGRREARWRQQQRAMKAFLDPEKKSNGGYARWSP